MKLATFHRQRIKKVEKQILHFLDEGKFIFLTTNKEKQVHVIYYKQNNGLYGYTPLLKNSFKVGTNKRTLSKRIAIALLDKEFLVKAHSNKDLPDGLLNILSKKELEEI